MSEQPLVSIVVNNYNYGRYLAASIDSALRQGHPRCEVIVVDDGSTDGSAGIIGAYGEQVRAVLKPNGGQASAFNAGFAASRGDMVIFLDADDVLLPEAAGAVAAAFMANPGAAKIQYHMAVIDGRGQQTGAMKPAPHLKLPSGDLRERLFAFPFDLTWMATSGNAFAASALRQIMPMPEQAYGQVYADWYISFLTPLFGPVVALDDVLACYRVHGANNYEPNSTLLNLRHIRATIVCSRKTAVYLCEFGMQLQLPGCPERPADVIAVSDVANRLVSLRLEPHLHPIPTDRPLRLLRRGISAARRRFEVSPLLRLAFILWFALVAVAPRPLVRYLAELFFFPERRPRINRLLAGLHRPAVESL